jgi:hypothetical protein
MYNGHSFNIRKIRNIVNKDCGPICKENVKKIVHAMKLEENLIPKFGRVARYSDLQISHGGPPLGGGGY